MGTRGNIVIIEHDIELVRIYRQYDSYPSALGLELQEILGNSSIINGFSPRETQNLHNGMGCLAATLIKNLKDGIGNIYINPVHKNRENIAEDCIDYTYVLKNIKGRIYCTIYYYGKQKSEGYLDDLDMNNLKEVNNG